MLEVEESVFRLPEVLEMMGCVPLCLPEAAEGVRYVLELLEVIRSSL